MQSIILEQQKTHLGQGGFSVAHSTKALISEKPLNSERIHLK